MTWHKIADHINELNFSTANIAVAKMNGKNICVAKFKEEIFAFAYQCPHAGGFLADGYIDVLRNTILEKVRLMYKVRYPYTTEFLY